MPLVCTSRPDQSLPIRRIRYVSFARVCRLGHPLRHSSLAWAPRNFWWLSVLIGSLFDDRRFHKEQGIDELVIDRGQSRSS
jgi:hypothetical protein